MDVKIEGGSSLNLTDFGDLGVAELDAIMRVLSDCMRQRHSFNESN